jgi:hypothetical protein
MRVRVIAVLLVLLTFVSGCGGGKTPAHAPATASARPAVPQPREPLAAAAQRLERALPGGRCEPLAALMLHSVVRGQDFRPADPPTDEECRYVRREARTLLKRFTVQRVVERGPAGVTEGKPRPNGDAIELIWVRDTDGSWKQLDGSYYRPQNGYPPERARFDSAAAAFVAGVKARDCDRMWRRLNVASRFVRSVDGRRGAFCKSIAQTFRLKAGGWPRWPSSPRRD